MNPPSTSASAVALPFKQANDEHMPSASQWGLAFILCCVLLIALLMALKRRSGSLAWRGQAGLLEVIERRALDARNQLVVARYAGRRLLLSVGPSGTQCLRDDKDGDAE